MLEFQGIPFIVTNPPLSPVSAQELSVVENELGFLFPDDYRAFITTFGAGEINLHIGAFSPKDILEMLHETRERFSEYWLWDESPTSLRQTRAIECVPFFDSCDGDDILFHPSERNCWFILPHEDEEIFMVQSFRELCNFYAQRYADKEGNPMQPPFEFSRYK